ncbi:MAG: (2Fe-2S)-binding protein [Marinovum algicola]|uniref:(2Fe-2S)-binding protein n=1 Tax=Roseobacteraceae TaxID=2854170 RepID=UPI0032EA9279
MTVQRISKGVSRGQKARLSVDGREIGAHLGESLAVALMAAGITTFRHSVRAGQPRGPFCLMGTCQECVVRIDGRIVQACQVPVAEGMEVTLG